LLDPGILVTLRDELGADFIDARVQRYYSELVVLDNGVVRELSINSNQGIGVRVIVKGAVGYSSTNSLEEAGVKEAVLRAYRVANINLV
jgi:TldD protein